jgi:tRNA pseudouridine55 synthase
VSPASIQGALLTVDAAGPARLEGARLAQGALLLIDKPSGPTSFDMVALLRRLSGVRRIGHAGTLDPFATGLLLLLTGPATRLQDGFLGADKGYLARLRLGAESDSHDRTGTILEHGGPLPAPARIEEALAAFRGEIDQVPPMHSAIKIGGRRLYKAARRGETVERPPRRVRIDRLELLAVDGACIDLEIACGKGTYIRSLARDLGAMLGCGALVEDLRRTASGEYRVERALGVEQLRERFRSGGDGVRGEVGDAH